jgi:hypothetical protein
LTPIPPVPLGVSVPAQFSQPSAIPVVLGNALVPGTTTTTATTTTATPAGGTTQAVGGTQVPLSLAQLAATEQLLAQGNQFAAAAAGVSQALSPGTLSLLNSGAALSTADLPFLPNGGASTLRLTPTTPPIVNVSLPQLATSANGQVPASLVPLGGFNRGLLTYQIEIQLTGGAGPTPEPGPQAAQPNNGPVPAQVQPAPADEPQEPNGHLVPEVGPAVDGNAMPILLAPENDTERLPGWEIAPPVERMEPVVVPVTPAVVPATPPVVSTAAVAARPSLWSRFVSVACFAAGALGAVWFPDIRELGTKRESLPVLRPDERRHRGVRLLW